MATGKRYHAGSTQLAVFRSYHLQVMLFMKVEPDAPRCGFSKTIVGILKEKNVKFGTFDILEDNEVRQGLLLDFILNKYSPRQRLECIYLVCSPCFT